MLELVRPKSFKEAIYSKYLDQANEENIVIAGKNVEMVGMQKIQDKIKNTQRLRSVSLQHEGVATAGNPNEIQELCPSLTELDLSFSMFQDWNVVQEICMQLPCLTSLDLSCNWMLHLTSQPGSFSGSFSKLKKLILNKTLITWKTVVVLSSGLSELEDLHIESNSIQSLNILDTEPKIASLLEPSKFFPKLRNVNLDENDFQNWDDLIPMEKLPKLETLVLNRNRLSDFVSINAFGSKAYASLTSLSIADNPIQNIEFVQSLQSRFPALKTLRISPLQKGLSYSQSRMMLIPQLPQIITLNGTKIMGKERTDAELLYLKHCAQLLVSEYVVDHHCDECTELPEKFCQAHPRYAALVKCYGNFLAEKAQSTTASADVKSRNFLQTLDVTIRSYHGGSMHKGDKPKKLPINFPISKLKLLCQSFYGLDPGRQKLIAKVEGTAGELPVCTDLVDDFSDLQHYCVCDGSIIEMHEI